MGLFKTAEEKQKEKALEERIEALDRFTGSLAEYNALKGKDYVIMVIARPKKFVYVDGKNREYFTLQSLMSYGCTGFVRYFPLIGTSLSPPDGGFGIPVKRK